MDIVCASPFAHQFGAVQYMRRSFASGSRWDPPSTGSDCVHLCIVGGSIPSYGERLRPFVYYVVVEYRVGDRSAYNIHRL